MEFPERTIPAGRGSAATEEFFIQETAEGAEGFAQKATKMTESGRLLFAVSAGNSWAE